LFVKKKKKKKKKGGAKKKIEKYFESPLRVDVKEGVLFIIFKILKYI